MSRQNFILLAAAALIAAIPLFMTIEGEDVFAGADGQAEAMVEQLRPGYTPWAEALWTPPSGEIESLLFMLQAGLGAGLLGYYLGLRRGETRRARGEAERAGGKRRIAPSDVGG
jgi:cobalt/nickel transport protein